jgi:hypothetical protein
MTKYVTDFMVTERSVMYADDSDLKLSTNPNRWMTARAWLDAAMDTAPENGGEYDPIHSGMGIQLLEAIVQRRLLEWCINDGDECIRRIATAMVATLGEVQEYPYQSVGWVFGSMVARNLAAVERGMMTSIWGSAYNGLFGGKPSPNEVFLHGYCNPSRLYRRSAAEMSKHKLIVKPSNSQWLQIANGLALITPPQFRRRWQALPLFAVEKFSRGGTFVERVGIPSCTLATMLEGSKLLPRHLKLVLKQRRDSGVLREDYESIYRERQKYAVWASGFDYQMKDRMAAWDKLAYERLMRHSAYPVGLYQESLNNNPLPKFIPPWDGPVIQPLRGPDRVN